MHGRCVAKIKDGGDRQIKARTQQVDRLRSTSGTKVPEYVEFNIPKEQRRTTRAIGNLLQQYHLTCGEFKLMKGLARKRGTHILLDSAVQGLPFVHDWFSQDGMEPRVFEPSERELKNVEYLNGVIKSLSGINIKSIVVIGGGVLMNCGAYIAERLKADLYHLPTTLLAMADGAGGKVRVNAIIDGECKKHYYRTYYLPNAIYADPRFLDSLPENQKRIGLVEIVKHGIFQSEPLYDYLMGYGRRIYQDTDALYKAAMWAAELKSICLDADFYELGAGRELLRAGHDISDRIEEESGFTIPHGYAVALGIISQLENGGYYPGLYPELPEKANRIFKELGIPRTMEEYYS